MKLYEKLLEISKKDLESARINYDAKLYPHAIFGFQQSVEKSNKAFGLMSNQITEEMLRNKIGHKILKIHINLIKKQKKNFEDYKKLMEQKIINESSIIQKKEIEKSLKSMNKFLRETKKIKKKPLEYINIPKQELRKLIESMENNFDNLSKVKTTIEPNEEEVKSMKSELMDLFSNMKKRYGVQYNQIKEAVDNLKIQDLKESIIIMYESFILIIPAYYSLIILSCIMQPHVSLSRYPENDFDPNEFYKLELPLVKLLPELMNLQEKTINGIDSFEKYVKDKNKNNIQK